MHKLKTATVKFAACCCAAMLIAAPIQSFAEPQAEEAAVESIQDGETVAEESNAETDETVEETEAEEPSLEVKTKEKIAEKAKTKETADAKEAETTEEQESTAETELVEQLYTAPEDTNHVNVSFRFVGSDPIVYPITLKLKEVDTGVSKTIKLQSLSQIVELEHGDYKVSSIKDSGRYPLIAAEGVLGVYDNIEYSIQFKPNMALKIFTNFLMDNVLLLILFAVAAFCFQTFVIKNFNKHPRR